EQNIAGLIGAIKTCSLHCLVVSSTHQLGFRKLDTKKSDSRSTGIPKITSTM
ncbi:unnamed protein product, partial [Ascophyllum nodosum]